MTVRDLTGAGTAERTWQAELELRTVPPLAWEELAAARRVVVIAPHPDDEVLGVGGTLARLAHERVPVLVVAVTDGERSHPGRADELRDVRARERAAALDRLGVTADLERLGLPDSGVEASHLRPALQRLLRPGDVLLSPWEQDGHPDHDACGRATRGLGESRWSYVVWGWHWSDPAGFPRDRARRVDLTEAQLALKAEAVQAFTSQLEGPAPILPPHVQARLLRDCEILLTEDR